jgi:hypothetical protein
VLHLVDLADERRSAENSSHRGLARLARSIAAQHGQILLRPHELRAEPRLTQPSELLHCRARAVEAFLERDHRVLGPVRTTTVAEHEAASGTEHLGNAAKEIGLPSAVR